MGMLGKVATTIIGTRIAAESGKAGLIGTAVGMLATRLIARSPAGAIAIGGAYVAHKLWQKKKQIDKEGAHQAAIEDGLVKPGDPPVGKRTVTKAPPINTRLVKAKPLKNAAVGSRPASP
jgi:hypothetical protein